MSITLSHLPKDKQVVFLGTVAVPKIVNVPAINDNHFDIKGMSSKLSAMSIDPISKDHKEGAVVVRVGDKKDEKN